MSAFTGNNPPNRKAHRKAKREQAIARNATANARMRLCGHVHGDALVSRCEVTR